jgi:hypothetical protein
VCISLQGGGRGREFENVLVIWEFELQVYGALSLKMFRMATIKTCIRLVSLSIMRESGLPCVFTVCSPLPTVTHIQWSPAAASACNWRDGCLGGAEPIETPSRAIGNTVRWRQQNFTFSVNFCRQGTVYIF